MEDPQSAKTGRRQTAAALSLTTDNSRRLSVVAHQAAQHERAVRLPIGFGRAESQEGQNGQHRAGGESLEHQVAGQHQADQEQPAETVDEAHCSLLEGKV